MASGEEKRGDRGPVGRVLGKAMTNVVNLGVAGAAAAGAAALGSWPIAAIGGIAYAALVAWDMSSEKFWKKAVADEPPELPDPKDLADPATREGVQGILKARKDLEGVLEETGDEVKSHLGMTLSSVAELEQRSIRLIQRAEDLFRYLSKTEPALVHQDIARLEERARAARDPQARKEYESARAAREDQLRALTDIAAARDRALANLSRVVATLEGLPAKVVRMRALDAQAMDQISGSMHDELEHMNSEMQAFEETLRTLGEISAS